MKGVLAFLLVLLAALAMPQVSRAQPDTAAIEGFSNPVLEARARNLQRQLRCLMCPGESVDESNSPFSTDIRHAVRQQVGQGKSDQQILDFLVARYGNAILMKPPVQPDTWLLWLAPFLVLATGGTVAWFVIKKAASREA